MRRSHRKKNLKIQLQSRVRMIEISLKPRCGWRRVGDEGKLCANEMHQHGSRGCCFNIHSPEVLFSTNSSLRNQRSCALRDENRFKKAFSNFHKFHGKHWKIEKVITEIFQLQLNCVLRKAVPVDLRRHFSLFAAGEYSIKVRKKNLCSHLQLLAF